MSLYTPEHFATSDRAAVARLLHDHPFATLITPGVPEPLVSHLPLLFVPGCEPHGTLIGHFARANPHWKCADTSESIAVFHGPHAYVSPTWYEHPDQMVPTWNYAAVHAHGTMDIIEDLTEARSVLDALVHRFEHHRPAPWYFEMPPRQGDAMVGAIVAFRMRIKRIDAKFKLSQNRSAEDRRRVVDGLRADQHADATATAAWMDIYAQARSDKS
ncbi:MAG: FMN-binding negative transcriptional regulator [Betaproteobacteria bacterium]